MDSHLAILTPDDQHGRALRSHERAGFTDRGVPADQPGDLPREGRALRR